MMSTGNDIVVLYKPVHNRHLVGSEPIGVKWETGHMDVTVQATYAKWATGNSAIRLRKQLRMAT